MVREFKGCALPAIGDWYHLREKIWFNGKDSDYRERSNCGEYTCGSCIPDSNHANAWQLLCVACQVKLGLRW
jgi:hypothetical protein